MAANVHQRKPGGVWTMQLTFPGTSLKKICCSTFLTDRTLALEMAKKREAEILKENKREIAGKTLLSAANETYNDMVWSNKRYGAGAKGIADNIVKMMGDEYIQNIDTIWVRGMVGVLRKKKLANATINHYISALKCSMEYTAKVQPFVLPDFEFFEARKRLRYFTTAEVKAIPEHFIKIGRQDIADLFYCLLDCGFRAGEMLGCGKIDVKSGSLISSFSLEHNSITSFINKTMTPRTLPLSRRMRGILERRGEIPFENLEYHHVLVHWFGVTATAGRRWHRIGMQQILGLGSDGVLHVTRHTYATNLLANGCDLVTLQHALGHKRIETTMRYAHFDKKMLLTTVGIINKRNNI